METYKKLELAEGNSCPRSPLPFPEAADADGSTCQAHGRPVSVVRVVLTAPADHARGRAHVHLPENVDSQSPGHVRRGRSGAQILPTGADHT